MNTDFFPPGFPFSLIRCCLIYEQYETYYYILCAVHELIITNKSMVKAMFFSIAIKFSDKCMLLK